MSAVRPKPWETAGTGPTVPVTNEAEVEANNVPELPARTNSMDTSLSSPYSYGAGSMYGSGMGGFGSMGGYGGMYGGMGGMYGGMGGMYGGYGSRYGMGGMGGYGGMGGNGAGGFGESTQATFQLIESVIGAFAGFSQMLEATYMATHSSFYTMISVAEQFGALKEMLGSFLGIFTLIKFCKKMINKLLGRSVVGKISVEDFRKFEALGDAPKKRTRLSLKPLLMFVVAVFGFPFLLNKFIQKLAQRRVALDPKTLQFARAKFDFVPENPQHEAALKKGDLMAILSTKDSMGKDSEWWRVRCKNGSMGYVPSNYLEVIQRKQSQIEAAPVSG